jgi:hypothetical protein
MNTLTTRLALGITAGAIAVGMTLGGVAATGASAAPARSYIAVPNAMVGVATSIVISAPTLSSQVVTIGLTNGTVATNLQTTIATSGYGSISWTPPAAGSWTISGLGNAITAGSTTINVVTMPTTSYLLAPNFVQVGVPSNIVAVVNAPIGSIAPTGTVTLRNGANQNIIGTGTLAPYAGTETATATIAWTPSSTGVFPLVANYTPDGANFTASTTPISQPNVQATNPIVSLSFPPTLYQNQSTVLTGVLGNNQPAGSMAFSFNGNGISGSIPTGTNGVSLLSWTPPAAGVGTIGVNYSGNPPATGSAASGTSSQPINVLPPQATDSIVIDPPNMAPWSIAAPIVVQTGSNTTLTTSAASGATVTLTETGPCVLNGAVMTALAAGQCQVTAVSPGSATFQPSTKVYTVTVTAPPRRPANRR